MGKKKKTFLKSSKWENEVCLIESEILRFEEHNKICPNDRYKNVFYCKSKKPEGRMCVLWGRTIAEEGDEIVMKGRFKGEVFLVWSMMIKKRNNHE